MSSPVELQRFWRTVFGQDPPDINERAWLILSRRTEGHTLDQVGKLFNVTRERIRQIETSTLRDLRQAAAQRSQT